MKTTTYGQKGGDGPTRGKQLIRYLVTSRTGEQFHKAAYNPAGGAVIGRMPGKGTLILLCDDAGQAAILAVSQERLAREYGGTVEVAASVQALKTMKGRGR